MALSTQRCWRTRSIVIIALILITAYGAISTLPLPAYGADSSQDTPILAKPILPEDILKHSHLTGTYRVKHVIDDMTLLLDNHSIIRLAGLDIPFRLNALPQGDLNDGALPHVTLSYEILKQEFEGQNILFYQSSDSKALSTNRMGHQIGHVIRSNDKIWAQGLLLQAGMARVRLTPQNTDFAPQMLELERQARQNNTGIWAPPLQMRIYDADDIQTISKHENSLEIIRGTVASVASINNTIYLNFGNNWRQDFTAAIPVSLRKDLQRLNQDPLQWQGMDIQMRGWVESYNGPMIKIHHIHQLDSIIAPSILLNNEANEPTSTLN